MKPVFTISVIQDIGNQIYHWGTADSIRGALDICQYILDGCSPLLPLPFGLYIEDNRGRRCELEKFIRPYGLRRRSFDERMRDVKTYRLDVNGSPIYHIDRKEQNQ